MFDLELEPQFSDQEIEAITVAEFAVWDQDSSETQIIPSDLAEWEPGPYLGVVLSAIDPARVTGHDRVTLMKAHARQVSHDQAAYYRSIGEVATSVPNSPDPLVRSDEWFEYANMEVRAALTLTRRAADSELGFAHDLLERLPEVWGALDAGTIDIRKAREIARGTGHLQETDARDVADRVLPAASGLTTGQLRARIQRLCLETNPEDASDRLSQGLEDRRVFTQANPNGTADLLALQLAPHRVSSVNRRINGIALQLNKTDETRTMDQIRADVFIDLLLGESDGNGRQGGVEITVDLKTLADLSESPGELAGYGPVIADIARQVTQEQRDTQWRTRVVDDNGQVIHTGTTRRRPDARLKREILASYPTCAFPGCRMPATDCDIDHRDPWSKGGDTSFENNAPLCRHDHVGRHKAGWEYIRLPDGRHQWISPLGHTYLTGGRPP